MSGVRASAEIPVRLEPEQEFERAEKDAADVALVEQQLVRILAGAAHTDGEVFEVRRRQELHTREGEEVTHPRVLRGGRPGYREGV